MPSPFPGMDPYLEDPGLWPDFHNALAYQIRDGLNRRLPDPYYAQLEMRSELGVVGNAPHGRVVPDVGVRRSNGGPAPVFPGAGGGVATAVLPRTEATPTVRIITRIERVELASIVIRDSRQGQELVTLIEIASPANERSGPDRDDYVHKLRATLESRTSLVEIDLLRRGQRTWSDPVCAPGLFVFDPPADYLVVASRAWERGDAPAFQALPIRLTEMLPVISTPLRQAEQETTVDLQYCFNLAYDGGPYWRGAVDYDEPPVPPLPEDRRAWAAECVLRWRTGSAVPSENGP